MVYNGKRAQVNRLEPNDRMQISGFEFIQIHSNVIELYGYDSIDPQKIVKRCRFFSIFVCLNHDAFDEWRIEINWVKQKI